MLKLEKLSVPSRSYWAEEQPRCLGGHHPGQWWCQQEACSIPHRGWSTGDGGGWYGSSCCHGQYCRPTQLPQQPRTPWWQPSRQEHQHQHGQDIFALAEKTVGTSNLISIESLPMFRHVRNNYSKFFLTALKNFWGVNYYNYR